MPPKLHDPLDSTPLWSTFHAQRVLGVGIAALAFAPLVQNARAMWEGPAQTIFLFAVALLAASIVMAQASLGSHRSLVVQHARYANKRREKEAAVEMADKQGLTDEWQTYVRQLNVEDQRLAEDAGRQYQSLERWVWGQYGTAILGALTMVVSIIRTPVI